MTAARLVDKSAAVAFTHAARRLLPEKPPRGRRSPVCRPLRAPCRPPPRRLRHIALVRGRAGSASGVRPHLGRAQLFLARPAAAPADLGGAVACADRHSDRAVAVQTRHPHDDGHLRGRDDHRRRHVLVLPKGQSGPGRETRARRGVGDAGDGPAVAGRAVPGAARHCLARMPPLLGRARRAVVGGADRPGGRVLSASIRLQIRALGFRCGRRPDDRGRVGCRSRDCGPVEPRHWRGVLGGPQAAAYRHGVRRVELRCHHDARMSKLRPNYRERFRSSDGETRAFVVEGAGGPSWYTEYNVLTGLSVRSYGRFAESVTRLAAGRVKRGLPYALRKCGYSTYSLYSWFGAFAGARGFQTSTGIEHFLDAKQLHTGPADTDIFFYDHAARGDRSRARHRSGFRLRLSRRQPLPLGLPLPSRSLARLGQSWKPVRDRRISSPPGDERARLRAIQSASWARISRPAVPARALRRPPAAVCQAVHRPDARPGRGGRAHSAARSPLFHHLLRRPKG